MKHGELKEYIAAGTTRNEFMRRVQSSFNIPTTAEPPSPVAPAADAPPTTAAASSAAVSSEANQSDEVRRVLEERAAVMKAKEKRAEEAKKKAKANPKPKAEGQVDARKNAEAELAKQRRAQQAEDRKRILKRIEQDKEERRQLAAQKEQQRNDMRSADGVTTGPVSSIRPSKTSEMTAIQVRLFDGSTIRSRFKSNSTVKDVRKWVDETRTDGKLPYTFKQLLTPMPSKAVEETEENKQLDETGLSPSSTLILIPVRHFASAYDGASQGIVGRVFALLLSFFTWILSLVGLGGAPEQAPVRTIPVAQDKERCRNVQDAQDRRDQQLYNGNSVCFNPTSKNCQPTDNYS